MKIFNGFDTEVSRLSENGCSDVRALFDRDSGPKLLMSIAEILCLLVNGPRYEEMSAVSNSALEALVGALMDSENKLPAPVVSSNNVIY